VAKQVCKFYYPSFKSVVEQLKKPEQFYIQNSIKNFNFEKFLQLKNISFKFEDKDKYIKIIQNVLNYIIANERARSVELDKKYT
jgi:hypothetical protein